MTPIYRIHPAIGIARVGDSPDEFYLAPEKPAALPTACDSEGNPLLSPDGRSELPVSRFKDAEGRIKRQAARFHLYAYDEASPEGRPLRLGDPIEGGGNRGSLVDIQWRAYLANKKSAWYEFLGLSGEHGYEVSHPLRNAGITEENIRQQLIIDPGPRFVNATDHRRARFERDGNGVYAATFPPPLFPHSIDTLGELLTDHQGRLLVLGGHGRSGSWNSGIGYPRIDHYANNDGWFDDIADGPVMARLVMYSEEVGRLRYIDVEAPAWVIVGYPRYAPQILDLVTLDDVVYDLSVRQFAYRTDLYGVPGTFDCPERIAPNDPGALQHWNAGPLDWNPDYQPHFYRDIWPILFRADEFSYLNNILAQSNFPHNQSQRGNFDVTRLSVPPLVGPQALRRERLAAAKRQQQGLSFANSLETKLLVFDDAVDKTLRQKIQSGGMASEAPGATLLQQVRVLRAAVRTPKPPDIDVEGLQEAASEFAARVVPGGVGNAPDRYLAEWKDANQADDRDYQDARNALRERLMERLEPFIAATIARWEQGLSRTGSLLAALRAATPGDGITQVVREAVRTLTAESLTVFLSGSLLEAEFHKAVETATSDPYRDYRQYLYQLLRQAGEENVFRTAGKPNNRLYHLPLMPLLAGDNPVYNELPSKFLRLTDTQLYLLRQWAEGKFYNELDEGWAADEDIDPYQPYKHWSNATGRALDRGVLSNLLGGAFFPGAEVCWVIRNPSIYTGPYRLKADPATYDFGQTAANANAQARAIPVTEQVYLGASGTALSQRGDFGQGLQPGDLTKYSAVPWQADFNECTTEVIDITYELWNQIDPTSENDPWLAREQKTWEALWWPAHRPLQTYEVAAVAEGGPSYQFLGWSRSVPQTNAGDFKMVTEWSRLGFVVRNPYLSPSDLDAPSPDVKYISLERNS